MLKRPLLTLLACTFCAFNSPGTEVPDEIAPVVEDTTPTTGEVVLESTFIEVVFSENVQGVEASDLLINGQPATGITVVSPRDYVFEFASLADGLVTAQWADGHNITDLSAAQNRFAGGTWTYSVDSTTPPANLIITEFMADNENGIRDDDAQRSDWIEIYNAGTDAVNLDGWFLTDTKASLTKYRIPPYSLGANNYVIIWASAKNRTNTTAQFHTNFKLSKDPSYLALVGPRTNIVSEFAPAYPAQRSDISYGRDAVDPTIKGFFNVATPGKLNAAGGAGFGSEPVFSLPEGVYTNAVISVSITASAGEIRFTRDGTNPTATSTLYTNAINITNSTTIKARVFQPGALPSAVVAMAYMMVDATVANFTSKLPVIMISTSGRTIADHPPAGSARTFASVIGVDTFRGIASTRGEPDYIGQGGISIRGQTSAGFPKRPYRLELRDEYGNDRDSDWFGFPEGSDWVLNNPYSDKPFLQNFLAQELYENMGHYAVRRRFVEVFVNTANRKITYPGDYHGVYLLLEKIKIEKNRVPIERLSAFDNAEPKISGGYMFKKDKDSIGDKNFTTTGGAGFSAQTLKIHEPAPREITTNQFAWLVNYVKQFEKALYAADWKTRTGTNHYSHYIDVDSFVDQHWIVEFAKQIDGYRLSNYFSKDRNGKIKMEPIWDYNLSFGNADYLTGNSPTGWYWNQIGDNEHIWLRRLMAGTTAASGTTGDADFNQRITDRWSQLRTNVLSSTNVLARVDEMAALLSEAADRDFKKWPRLGRYIWPNSPQYVTPTTYAGIITAMKNFIRSRYTWIDSQFILPPKATIPEGKVPPGINVQLSATGTNVVYYTLDGTDPRLPGGAINPNAMTNSGPITITKTSRLFARAKGAANKWSGPTALTYILETPKLVISEIMYHPAQPTGAAALLYIDEDFEFLEFKNIGSTPINLGGFSIVEGVSFTFPGVELAVGGRTLVVKNRAAFESRYGTGLPIAGEFVGQLDNGGETITALGSQKEPILSFSYSDDWMQSTDGPGFSLRLTNEGGTNEELSQAASWAYETKVNGTPGGADNVFPLIRRVVISEVLTRPGAGDIAQVELQNLSSEPADISGWFITDDFDTPKKYRIPSPTIMQPGAFVVFSENDFRSVGAIVPFIFNPQGEAVYLFAGNAQTNLTGYVHGFEFGLQRAGDTILRHVNSAGREMFVTADSPTLGAANSGPAVPLIQISEIMYHPPEVSANGALWNNTEDEYIELFNRSGAEAKLFDAARPTNGWRISGAATFTFPANATIPSGGHALVVNFDPTNVAQLVAFRQKYNVPVNVPIFGPYGGNLNNAGETITLSAPDVPLSNGTVPYVTVEEVEYDNAAPWPAGADGTGFALNRLDSRQFGNDPANWAASRPAPGLARTTVVGPIILQHPASQIAAAGQTVRLVVSAMGQGLRYQWRFGNGNLVNGTNDTLVITNIQPAQSGAYSVVVMTRDASTTSKSARVTVGTDYDGDSVEDDWELANGLNPFDATDASADADGDGVPNRDEYIVGTAPRDGSSYLVVDEIETGVDTAVKFQAAANRTYTIQFTDSLSPVNWQKLTDVFGGAEGVNARIADPNATTTRYYRVVSPAQP